ncbi:hypothetical protein ABN028_09790 [Actinopolymorpha sp. B17G11]|uniref:hypothetical protein n=1 Tax=unclassified Actinopolymorpha TaxID=2627063 RepID=UPI0032D94F1D
MLSVQPLGVLAAAPRDPSQWVGPGLLGFVVIVSIGVATFLLWRNMNKQLRRVKFEERPGRSGRGAPTSSALPDGSPASGADTSDQGGGGHGAEPTAAEGTAEDSQESTGTADR